jgi:hypothetical protein
MGECVVYEGTMSTFGGRSDLGMKAEEGLALFPTVTASILPYFRSGTKVGDKARGRST